MNRFVAAFVSASCAACIAGCASSDDVGEVKLGVDTSALQVVARDLVTEDEVPDVTATEDGTTTADAAAGDIVLTRVRLLLSTVKVGYTGGDPDEAVEIGPFVVDLTAEEIASGAYRELSLGELAAGTYGGAEIEIEPIDAASAPDDTFADFTANGASLIVDGTYGDKVFQFMGHFLAEQGTDGEVEVSADAPLTLALTVDASSWFVVDGVTVDPTDEAQHDTLAVAICTTLDTQESPSGGDAPAGGDGRGGRGGPGGPGGGGDGEHCVE